MSKINKQKEHFDSISAAYTEARKDKRHLAVKNAIWEEALSTIKFKPRIKVLEAMCGVGDGANLIASYTDSSIEYHGFDFSEHMVNTAKSNVPTGKIWQQDVTKLDVFQEYDVVILLGGLHHVYEHAESVVKKLWRALTPSGLFINFEPTHANPLYKLIREAIYKKNSFFDAETEQGFVVDSLHQMFKKSGFRIVKALYPGLVSYVLWYNPDAFPLLNRGNTAFADWVISKERFVWGSRFAKVLSFSTLTICQKDEKAN